MAAARAGRGQIVLISGEPGIGKTAILAALLDRAATVGARIASGAAEELQMRVPFAAVSDCLGLTAAAADAQAAEIAAMLRGAHRSSGGAFSAADAEFLVTEAILGLVDGWCTAGPVVLAVDDLQWADPASLLVLHRLGRVAGQLPLLLAVTQRPGAGPGVPADLERLLRSWEARGADLLSLGPLDEASVAALTRQVAGGDPDESLRTAAAAAAGNPLYVIELARASAGRSAQAPVGHAGGMPESLITVVTRRLSGLSGQSAGVGAQRAASTGRPGPGGCGGSGGAGRPAPPGRDDLRHKDRGVAGRDGRAAHCARPRVGR